MLFARKSKGYFVDFNDHGILLARTSTSDLGPMEIEQILEVPAGDEAALGEALKQLQPAKGQSGYVHATVGVYPPKRFVRHASLDLKRIKDPGYLNELVSTQCRLELDKATIAVLSTRDGSDFDLTRSGTKDILCCGLLNEEVISMQDRLLACGIYPQRVELGTVAALGAIVNLLAAKKSSVPTLVIEIGAETTYSFIVSAAGVDSSRPIPQGFNSMIPMVQQELNLKDEESARRLFFSNTFDFTGMGPVLIKKLLRELHSSIGFYEVQTGQSIGQLVCMLLPTKLSWIETVISSQLGVNPLKPKIAPWLQAQQLSLPSEHQGTAFDARWLGLFGLMAHHNAPVPQEK
jgi:hypothetical protein